MLKRILRSINAWMFICGIGALHRKYIALSQPLDKAAFCMDHFGISWRVLLDEYEKCGPQSFIDGLVTVSFFNEENDKHRTDVLHYSHVYQNKQKAIEEAMNKDD